MIKWVNVYHIHLILTSSPIHSEALVRRICQRPDKPFSAGSVSAVASSAQSWQPPSADRTAPADTAIDRPACAVVRFLQHPDNDNACRKSETNRSNPRGGVVSVA